MSKSSNCQSGMQIVAKSRVLPRDSPVRKMATLDPKVLKINLIFRENRTHSAVYSCGSLHMEGGSQNDDVG